MNPSITAGIMHTLLQPLLSVSANNERVLVEPQYGLHLGVSALSFCFKNLKSAALLL